jgi:hypothetical protein
MEKYDGTTWGTISNYILISGGEVLLPSLLPHEYVSAKLYALITLHAVN